MPRYIEATKCAEIISEKLDIRLFDLVDVFAEIPSADVVPKSEVSILTVQNMALENTKSELQHELNKYKGVENILKDNMGELIMAAIVQAKQELASEIFAEIDNILYKFAYPSLTAIGNINVIQAEGYHLRTRDYAELKKKYTEGEE